VHTCKTFLSEDEAFELPSPGCHEEGACRKRAQGHNPPFPLSMTAQEMLAANAASLPASGINDWAG
jgi:hypothetical protein